MKFYFNKVILWLDGNIKREIEFMPDKVNVITGDSSTGKSAILQIIDYCLFASDSTIPESVINEHVLWYGINIAINEKRFTICRKALKKGHISKEYYFSSLGINPDIPLVNNDEDTIKSLLETEFEIDRNIRIPFGGQTLKAGSKISLRYFLMFTTISEDIITNSKVYFDKQTESRYREALPRVFDLAVGIDDLENILKREEKNKIANEIGLLEQREFRVVSKANYFRNELNEISRRALELGLIGSDTKPEGIISALKKAVTVPALQDGGSSKYNQLKRDEFVENKVIRNLNGLKSDYEAYKSTLGELEDSVLPIKYLHEQNAELVRTSIFHEIVTALEEDLISIRRDLKKSTPIDVNITNLLSSHQAALAKIRTELSSISVETHSFESDRAKYFFLGELKAKLELYGDQSENQVTADFQAQLDKLVNKLGLLDARDVTEARDSFIKLLEEIIQKYILIAGNALENYTMYQPVFDYTRKILSLRKPLTEHIENIGSSSNHMFLHLFLFLGLHEAMHRKEAHFVPSYLIIDQPSRPYWGDGEKKKKQLDHSDEAKIRKAFELLNSFVECVTVELKNSCQLIVFEHVPPSTWTGLNHVHLVEEFTDGNALIPYSYLNN